VRQAALPIEVGGLYVLEGRLVRIDRRENTGQIVVHDQIDGTERYISAGMLSARPLDCTVNAGAGAPRARSTSEEPAGTAAVPDICRLTDAQKKIALERLAVIRPLIDLPDRTEQDVIRRAREAKLSARTLFRWLASYLETGLAALAPNQRGVRQGTVLLDPRVEEIINVVIRKAFAEGESSSVPNDLEPAIRTACDRLPPAADGRPVSYPGEATIQRRLAKMRRDFKNHVGETRRVLRDKQQPVTGYIDAEHGLHIVEIDHTVMDVHVVDDETLEPIGRPTFTIAIDDFTRCVLGFVLTLLPPSALAAGLCLQRMRFPKEAWLEQLGLEQLEWPMYGAPLIVQTDSAREFLAPGFRYGCQKMGAQARTRLIAQPRYGGTVERLIGKLMRKFRLLPGSTYNDMLKKATRKPIRDALYTVAGLEWEVVREIGRYHDQRHSALGMTPRQAWDKALESQGQLGPPLPIVSPELFLVDFLPRIERPVTRMGVEQGGGGRRYWTEELRPLISLRQRVFVRPDPRDVRHVWIELPGEGGYVRARLIQPRDFTGVTELDWRAWLARRRGPPILMSTGVQFSSVVGVENSPPPV
jgi:putative transposase